MSADKPQLPRVLGPVSALCVIVGSVIGSGIFIVPARVAREIPALGPIALAWIVGGLFSLAGSLTLAELASMLPRAGGPYVYLRAAFGRLPAFLFGWTEFLVIRSGSVATLAAAFALYAAQIIPAPRGWSPTPWQAALAIAAMSAVALINILGTRWGSGVQIAGTALKVGALLVMIVLPFVQGRADFGLWTPLWPEQTGGGFLRHFMIAMVGVLWAYDGWVNTSNLAEEIKDPERNIPRSLIAGVIILISVYLSMTLVYHLVLPMAEISQASTEKGSPKAVSADFCARLLGPSGLTAISLVVMASTFISLNGNALSGPRAYFALARDGLFPGALARIHPRFQTPARAIAAQTAWAILLTLLGTLPMLYTFPDTGGTPRSWIAAAWDDLARTPLYDKMYTYVIFGATIFYALSILSVFVLRRTMPELPRPYKTWLYPITPLLFLVGALILLWSMLMEQPFESLAGLGIVAVGVLVYYSFFRGDEGGSIKA